MRQGLQRNSYQHLHREWALVAICAGTKHRFAEGLHNGITHPAGLDDKCRLIHDGQASAFRPDLADSRLVARNAWVRTYYSPMSKPSLREDTLKAAAATFCCQAGHGSGCAGGMSCLRPLHPPISAVKQRNIPSERRSRV
jgi:hypothetical protein